MVWIGALRQAVMMGIDYALDSLVNLKENGKQNYMDSTNQTHFDMETEEGIEPYLMHLK